LQLKLHCRTISSSWHECREYAESIAGCVRCVTPSVVPLIQRIVRSNLQQHLSSELKVVGSAEITICHSRIDKLLIKFQNRGEVLLRELDPILPSFGGKNNPGNLKTRFICDPVANIRPAVYT
jgi:hypothetical protein